MHKSGDGEPSDASAATTLPADTQSPRWAGPLQGKNILITGAGGSGVGTGVVDAVVAAGGTPILNDVDEGAANGLRARYPDELVLTGDVSDEPTVEFMFEKIAVEVGPLHGVVNNAGIGLVKHFYDATLQEQQRLFSVDVTATWLIAKEFTRRAIRNATEGSIVNISSIHAHSTTSGYALYASCKGAVESLTRGIAVEAGAFGIRCNAVAPGYVHSDQNVSLLSALTSDPSSWTDRHVGDQQAISAPVQAIDCGNLSVYLLSDLSRSLTGQTIRVDAGTTALVYGKDFSDLHESGMLP